MAVREKRCIFCGNIFTGQKRNFEHIIPAWLVKEADLGKRVMPVRIPGISRDVPMSRIGIKVCRTCNDADSELEGHAKIAFLAIKEGAELTDTMALVLLDWLDKVRLGLWLWLFEQLGEKALSEPKFRINGRLGRKDRMMLVQRYPEGAPMRGLGLLGMGRFFMGLPSTMGLLINNILLVSVSFDFLVLRHIRDVRIQQTHGTDEFTGFDLSGNAQNEPRLAVFGGPSIYAQCILPNENFEDFEVPIKAVSLRAEDWSESPILRLDERLHLTADVSATVPLFTGNIVANTILMERNVYLAAEYLMQDFQRADNRLLDPDSASAVKLDTRAALGEIRAGRAALDENYRRATGIQLPK